MLHVEPEALDKLVADGYSLAYGARFLKRVIDDQIKLPLSQQWKEANTFRAVVRDGQIDRGIGRSATDCNDGSGDCGVGQNHALRP